MFKKKPTIKTLSPLRSSDRRRTADRIIADYDLQPPQPFKDDSEEVLAGSLAHTALRNSLLPENSLSAKFTTTSGPNLKEVSGTVYIGTHEAGEQRVLWVKLDDRLYPTVYTLWNNPGIVPILHTPSVVIKKLQGGADLMIPGLAGPPFPSKATRGSIVAVASLENYTVPVVVGTCVIDVSSLQQTQGAKGHAVETLHWAGDELWDWSTTGRPGSVIPEELEGWDALDNTLAKDVNGLDFEDDEVDGGVALTEVNEASETGNSRNEFVSGENITAGFIDNEGGGGGMTTQDIDDAFRQAILYGLHKQKGSNLAVPKFGLQFPLTQSAVMATLVLPYLPASNPMEAEQLVIKKSSWKNVRKFIKSLEKQKLLLCKDRPSNEVDVLDVDFTHVDVLGFQPYRLPMKEVHVDATDAPKPSSTPATDDCIGQKLQRVELFKPTEGLKPLFQNRNAELKSLYTSAEIRTMITTYLECNNLISTTNKRLATLDPLLSNAVFTTTSPLDIELLAKGTCPRDILTDRILALCSPIHAILRNGETLDPTSKSKPKAGPAPKIGILLETRSGNKTVTRVHGLEAYFVNPQTLADELRKTCASSTSVEAWKAGKGMEVMVQGPQRDSVVKALERRGVRREWVEVVDKTKKGKR